MARTVVLDPAPNLYEPVPEGLLTVTPHASAAEAAGSPPFSLQKLAKETLDRAGLRVASEIESNIHLKRSIERIEGRSGGPAASSVKPILETVLRTGIDPAELRQVGSARVRSFASIAVEYETKMRELGLVDRSAILWQASRLEPEPRQLFIYGYFRARKEEIYFINAIAAEGSIFHLPCHADPIFKVNAQWAEWLQERGWTKHHGESATAVSIGGRAGRRFLGSGPDLNDGEVGAFSYADIETELRAVLGKVKALLVEGTAASEIAVVCRDAARYAPIVSLVASEYGLPAKIELKVPLAETFTGSFVSLLLDCAESGCDRESVLRLLRHPYGSGISESDWPRVQAARIAGVEEWKAVCADMECLGWADEADFDAYTNCLISALDRFCVREKAGRHARETDSYSCFVAALRETARVESRGKLPLEVFIAAVREILVSASTHFDPSAVGVRVCEPNVIIGGRFRHIFSVGTAEGIFPARPEDNPIIDFHERKRLIKEGIEFEEAAEVPRWEALSFYFLLLSARESLHLSYPRSIGSEVKIESSFFGKLGLEPARSHIAICASPEEYVRSSLRNVANTEAQLADARRRYEIELERESLDPCGEYDGAIGQPIEVSNRWFSVSQLTALGQCGFKWFARKPLQLSPAAEPEVQLSPGTRGSFYHRVLEIAFKKGGDGDIRTRLTEALEEAFAEAESDTEALDMPQLRNWDLQRAEHLETLRRAIASVEFIDEGAEPVAFEAEFRTEWEGFRLYGKIDRIDRTEAGLAAVDYKTGSSLSPGAQNAEGRANVDLQLAIYTAAALPALYPRETVKDGAYYSLSKGKRIKSRTKGEDLAAFAARARAMLESGDLSVGPDVDRKACTYCELDIVCRNGHRIVRKKASK